MKLLRDPETEAEFSGWISFSYQNAKETFRKKPAVIFRIVLDDALAKFGPLFGCTSIVQVKRIYNEYKKDGRGLVAFKKLQESYQKSSHINTPPNIASKKISEEEDPYAILKDDPLYQHIVNNNLSLENYYF